MRRTARSIAQYFLNHDPTGALRDKTLVEKNGRKFYAGNARLNKYLHIAQNLHIAKTGEKLFPESLYAYDNGAVVPEVQEYYSVLISKDVEPEIDRETAAFLDSVIALLENATLDELIEISHEDSEWQEKSRHYKKSGQEMDSLSHADEYKEQYADALYLLEGMAAE